MSQNFPYTYISCPCSDPSRRTLPKRASREIDPDELSQEDSTFDPRHPRSAFSLYPPEHLFYCEDCRDLKCPRCVVEEIVCWYCPDCLFEAAPSSVKNDGNRCARHCYRCPICLSQLITAATVKEDGTEGPFVLSCNYCMWSSLDVGMSFASASGIRAQMERRTSAKEVSQAVGRDMKSPAQRTPFVQRGSSLVNEVDTSRAVEEHEEEKALDSHTLFAALKSFYKDQLLASDSAQSSSVLDAAFSSPSSLSRIMSLYSTTGSVLGKKAKQKNTVMREALTTAEGLKLETNETAQNAPFEPFDYSQTTSDEQRDFQLPNPIGNPSAHSVTDLRPMPTRLRTKRSKRCAQCKHILVKPELKVTSTRYRIKLIALSYIPYVTIKPVPVTGGLLPAGIDGDPNIELEPGKPSQWILTLKNPLFDAVNVNLGSPNVTPGKLGHKVTILCPQFSIGKNGDVWDSAIGADSKQTETVAAGGEQIAGKVYDRGRNWTSIVIEVVPTKYAKDGEVLAEDDEVIEVPIRVRVEWKISDEQTLRNNDSGKKVGVDGQGEVDDGGRELAYWMVLGIGRVKM